MTSTSSTSNITDEPLSQSMERELSPVRLNNSVDENSAYETTFFDTSDENISQEPASIKDLLERVSQLELTVDSLKKENTGLKKIQKHLNEEFFDIWDRLYKNEVDLYDLNQYNRRENIVVSGIPADVPDNDVEKYTVEMLRHFGVHGLSSYEIAACHRLNSPRNNLYPKNVIIRFINRKRAYEALDKFFIYKKNNPRCRINIFENLCPQYAKIFNQCRKLKVEKKIIDTYTYEGKIYITTKNPSNGIVKRTKIIHQQQLDELFPNI